METKGYPVPEADVATLLAFFKAMANESRLRIVGLISAQERSGQELAEMLGLKEPTVSHHIAALKALGLVSVRAEGVTRWYRLRPEALTEFNKALFEPKDVAALAGDTPSWEVKVLASFVAPDGTLTQIPASRRKRYEVLKWLLSDFEEAKRYPEKAVNALIQAHHWDAATLRRELIGHGMLAREDGIYWRLPANQWRASDAR